MAQEHVKAEGKGDVEGPVGGREVWEDDVGAQRERDSMGGTEMGVGTLVGSRRRYM